MEERVKEEEVVAAAAASTRRRNTHGHMADGRLDGKRCVCVPQTPGTATGTVLIATFLFRAVTFV